jgi:hypothetical protein
MKSFLKSLRILLCGCALARAVQIGIVLAGFIFSNSAFASPFVFNFYGNGTEILSLTSPPPAGDVLQVGVQAIDGSFPFPANLPIPQDGSAFGTLTVDANVTLFNQNGVAVGGSPPPVIVGYNVTVENFGPAPCFLLCKTISTGSLSASEEFALPSDTAYVVISNTEFGNGFWAGRFSPGNTNTQIQDFFTVDDALGAAGFDVASSVTPLPATLPLFATGIGALGLLGWRKKRKASKNLTAG